MTDGDEPPENSLSPLCYGFVIPEINPTGAIVMGGEFFPQSANSDETSDYPRVLRFAVCKALRFGLQK